MTESVSGRLLLVTLVAAALWGMWNLTLRPYPSGSECGTPVAAFTKSSVDIPRRTEPRPPPERGALDRDGNGVVTDFEQGLYDAQPRVAESLAGVPGNASQRSRAQAAEAERIECRDALSEAGFWIRGAGPLAVVLGAVAVGRFVLTGRVRDARTGQGD